jgi:hypothetical protein
MKKRLLFVQLLLISISVVAQMPTQYLGTSGNRIEIRGQTKMDSIGFLPRYVDSPSLNAFSDTLGAFFLRTTDMGIYFRDSILGGGRKWTRWGPAIAGLPLNSVQFNLAKQFAGSRKMTYNDADSGTLTLAGVESLGRQLAIGTTPHILGADSTLVTYRNNARGSIWFANSSAGLDNWNMSIDTAHNFSNPLPNEVLSLGYGLTGTGASMRIGMEANYEPFPGAGFTQFEFHIPEIRTASSVIERPASLLVNKTTGIAEWLYSADNYIFNNSNNSTGLAFIEKGAEGLIPFIDSSVGGSSFIDLSVKDSTTGTTAGGVLISVGLAGGIYQTNMVYTGTQFNTIYKNGNIMTSLKPGSSSFGRNFVISQDNGASGDVLWVGAGWGQTFTEAFQVDKSGHTLFANEDINDNGAKVQIYDGALTIAQVSPAASALLDMGGTTKGFLGPRLTTAQMLAISSPATALEIQNSDSAGVKYFFNGTSWLKYNAGIVAGNFSQVGTATTTFTVTIGTTQANTNYKVNVTPTALLSAAAFFVTNKTTTTFDVVYAAGLTGTVTFDWSLIP